MLSRIARRSAILSRYSCLSTLSKHADKTKVFSLEEIEKCVEDKSMIIDSMKEGFISYSSNKVYCPSVLHFGGEQAPFIGEGDCVLKSGYIKGDKYYVIKVAGGSFKGQTSSIGVMLVFSQITGNLLGILLDEGLLTELRTAAACSLSAQYFAPKNIDYIGIVGTGIQARYQLEMLNYITPSINCKNVIVYGRCKDKLQLFKNDMINKCKWNIETTNDLIDIGKYCNLIITATTSKQALLFWDKHILQNNNINNNGIHIICMGADTNTKQELDENIIKNADLLIADSIDQCCQFGELYHSFKQNIISKQSIYEIGDILKNKNQLFRQQNNDKRIIIFDSTGVAVQDIVIAKMVYQTLINQK